MGTQVFPGRHTVETHEGFVVFIIGTRINKWWAIHKWWPVFTAMPPMIKELYGNKNLGCLSMENFFGLRTTLMVQYWRSEEDLLAYAKGQEHLTAWKNFNKKVGDNDAVGIYHETYVIRPGQSESIYGNMPVFGLAKALGMQPINSATNSAQKRLRKY
ncbi:DUF4188 domain-containing protein [Planomicrobium sp. CPCC 101110]|uniref:DUF4188 domain-containing protein n=1 Tax=Planomicrobium sp. CPCC 101110 TaxID=2599619 RepID=UPI0011B457A5|nr:DUF4188 domain-containing protein [Planomicrobium sp. CPCC 101110]TWT25157.1 DUF4188 domain-containing protein [Planomicrobium sp. CPCC 101110]